MKYLPDNTGRFRRRPHYEPKELDEECETLITSFLCDYLGQVTYPIPTRALTIFLERHVEDLDLYADLSGEGLDVEGLTEIIPGERPRVRISKELSEQPSRENRLRTTLTHEFGHVHFHAPLWQGMFQNLELFDTWQDRSNPTCKRGSMHDAPAADWLEWQAGYVCGAILMPRSAVVSTVREWAADRHETMVPVGVDGIMGRQIQKLLVEAFAVSEEAARVRLLKLNLLTAHPTPDLFSH